MGPQCERRAILERLLDCVPADSPWRARLKGELAKPVVTAGVHLAVFVEPFLTAVLEGRKTIESRFGVHRRPPYLCIAPDDYILIKRSGGPVVGLALAKTADFYQLSPSVLADIRERFAYQLYALDEEFWESRASKQYATLIELEEPTEIKPMAFAKRDRQGWVIIDRRAEAQLDLR